MKTTMIFHLNSPHITMYYLYYLKILIIAKFQENQENIINRLWSQRAWAGCLLSCRSAPHHCMARDRISAFLLPSLVFKMAEKTKNMKKFRKLSKVIHQLFQTQSNQDTETSCRFAAQTGNQTDNLFRRPLYHG